jgi:dynein heavy chain
LRSHQLPIDMVGYDFQMLGADPGQLGKPPPEGVYIHGLFLEGCGWDARSRALCESRPKALFVAAPCMWLRPRPSEQLGGGLCYSCPLYRTAERRGVLATTGHSTNFVMLVRMPTEVEPSHWVMRGVALLCQLSE